MPIGDADTIIWRVIVSPGSLQPEITRVTDDAGEVWLRLPGESEQEFRDRAAQAAKRNKWGVACLIAEGRHDAEQ